MVWKQCSNYFTAENWIALFMSNTIQLKNYLLLDDMDEKTKLIFALISHSLVKYLQILLGRKCCLCGLYRCVFKRFVVSLVAVLPPMMHRLFLQLSVPCLLQHSTRRYDTQFYVAIVDDIKDIQPSSDNSEVSTVEVSQWRP